MTTHQELTRVLAETTKESNTYALANMITGFLAGMSLALKEPDLAALLEKDTRDQWATDHGAAASKEDQFLPYGPGQMAEHMIKHLKPDKVDL